MTTWAPFILPLLVFLVVCGAVVAAISQRRRQLTCDCGHIWSIHQDEGNCLGETCRTLYDSGGVRRGHEWVPCLCVRYAGPTPAPTEDTP